MYEHELPNNHKVNLVGVVSLREEESPRIARHGFQLGEDLLKETRILRAEKHNLVSHLVVEKFIDLSAQGWREIIDELALMTRRNIILFMR